ncbi:hypothetical protein [Hyalangium rubrum]|uniref:Lipoprotein n=1 Tax=Hyalangium rubrum TaxID=3103134 RepID=A0ABU5HFW1_9BACT|nr:hypothetical protein [Hyalangium sp. s54d21]MDY7230950.1 hypothetical protein [Hyalangium sp. s54d21]
MMWKGIRGGGALRWWVVALVVAGAGCAKKQVQVRESAVRALCFSELPSDMRVVSPAVWRPEALFQLLINGYDKSTGRVPLPPTDCMGTPILWQDPAPGECGETAPDATPLPIQPLTVEEMIVTEMRLDLKLVWAVVRRYSNGEAIGPVALVEATPRGLAVRALGTLKAMPKSARLRLERIGGIEVLLVDGERCWGPEEGKTCQRMVRIMPLRGNRFVAEPLVGQDGKCMQPANIALSRAGSQMLPSKWLRKYEYTAALSVAPDGIRVAEQVTAKDSDPKQPSSPPRLFRKAQGDRLIQVNQSRMAVDRTSVWNQLLEPGATEALP